MTKVLSTFNPKYIQKTKGKYGNALAENNQGVIRLLLSV